MFMIIANEEKEYILTKVEKFDFHNVVPILGKLLNNLK